MELNCKICGKRKEEKEFAPLQRVDDGQAHICWSCEKEKLEAERSLHEYQIKKEFPYKMKKEKEKCPTCNKMKDDVEVRPNHYARDVGNEDGAMMYCCADCEHENAMAI